MKTRCLLQCMSPLLAHRDKSQSPEFTVDIDAKRTFVDKRSRPNLQRMTQSGPPSNRVCAPSQVFATKLSRESKYEGKLDTKVIAG